MAIRVFTSKLIRTDQYQNTIDIGAVAADFKRYKETGILPPFFGRDERYDRPASVVFAELQHIHTDLHGSGWRIAIEQQNRTSDAALVYCQGARSPDNYLLIAYLETRAHVRANKVTYMLALAEIAEEFRKRF